MSIAFTYAVGNPPYQASKKENDGNKEFAAPVYNFFLEEVFKIAGKVEFIHPARFLFNAGSTPKAWNQKMLHNKHYKILKYESDASKVFNGTDIKGGVVISYYDKDGDFGEIGIFTEHSEMQSVIKKVSNSDDFFGLDTIVITRTAYRLTDKMHEEHPEALSMLSNGHAYDMSTNIFERVPQLFNDKRPNDNNDYAIIIGRINNERVYKYIRRDYINNVQNYDKYKVLLAKANGIGEFGEVLSSPFVEKPGVGSTETFLSVGSFMSEIEADSCLNYIKTKFFRALLGVLKKTQDITPEKFHYIPLQDFTSNSDIDWSKSVHEIDLQLYQKYGLSDEEIDFIETHVKEMQ